MSNFPNQPANTLSAAGAISPLAQSNYFAITATGAIALTLAAPVADGQRVTVQDTTGHAHTITTPANDINGASHVVTFQSGSPLASAVAAFVELIAYNGSWWVLASSGVTIS